MWNRQVVVGVFFQLFLAILIHNADNAHNHWQDYEEDYENHDPNDVACKEYFAYKVNDIIFLCVEISYMEKVKDSGELVREKEKHILVMMVK